MRVSLLQLCIAFAAVCFAFGEETAETQQRTRWADHPDAHETLQNITPSYTCDLDAMPYADCALVCLCPPLLGYC